MAYLPRSEIIARLEDWYDIRLISADVIDESDLRDIYDRLEELSKEILELDEERMDTWYETRRGGQ